MIHVVQYPADGEPHAWFAFDGADFIRKVQLALPAALCARFAAVAPAGEAALDFWSEALAACNEDCATLWNDQVALDWLEDAARHRGSRGALARDRLREQLVSLELLEGI